jgi:hypothetical protein
MAILLAIGKMDRTFKVIVHIAVNPSARNRSKRADYFEMQHDSGGGKHAKADLWIE